MIYLYSIGIWILSILASSSYAYYKGYSYANIHNKVVELKIENQRAKLAEAYYKSAWQYSTDLNAKSEEINRTNKEVIDALSNVKDATDTPATSACSALPVIDADWLRQLDRLR